ncbi:hypothetical protein J6590_093904 [Homalodisca vitripennis]|nr:hypothetical protein J6590_093904 [Homalodisca vitripennis]
MRSRRFEAFTVRDFGGHSQTKGTGLTEPCAKFLITSVYFDEIIFDSYGCQKKVAELIASSHVDKINSKKTNSIAKSPESGACVRMEITELSGSVVDFHFVNSSPEKTTRINAFCFQGVCALRLYMRTSSNPMSKRFDFYNSVVNNGLGVPQTIRSRKRLGIDSKEIKPDDHVANVAARKSRGVIKALQCSAARHVQLISVDRNMVRTNQDDNIILSSQQVKRQQLPKKQITSVYQIFVTVPVQVNKGRGSSCLRSRSRQLPKKQITSVYQIFVTVPVQVNKGRGSSCLRSKARVWKQTSTPWIRHGFTLSLTVQRTGKVQFTILDLPWYRSIMPPIIFF